MPPELTGFSSLAHACLALAIIVLTLRIRGLDREVAGFRRAIEALSRVPLRAQQPRAGDQLSPGEGGDRRRN